MSRTELLAKYLIALVWTEGERIRGALEKITKLRATLRVLGVETMPWEEGEFNAEAQRAQRDAEGRHEESPMADGQEFRRARGPLSEKIVYVVRLRACLPEGAPGGSLKGVAHER